MAPEPPPELVQTVAAFVMPPTLALASDATFDGAWLPGGPWRMFDG